MTKFYFVRHGESEKNLLDINGGTGMPLTDQGKHQVQKILSHLKEEIGTKEIVKIHTSDTKQTIETSNIIANYFQSEVIIEDRLHPVGLGIIDGYSKEKIENEYPEYAIILKRWNNQEIDVTKFNIPGIEPPDQLWKRMTNFLDDNSDKCVHIIICTRSIMVMIKNFINNNTPHSGKYIHQPIHHCECICFEYNDQRV